MILDEYSKSMNVMLTAVNKRYVVGVIPWLDGQPQLGKKDQELEQCIVDVWNDRLSVQRFQEVLREYYQFWLKAIRDFKAQRG